VSLPGFPAFNKAISGFRFFAHRVETRPQHRDAALRAAFLCAALASVALDAAVERIVYDDISMRYDSIIAGVAYGDTGDGKVQQSISRVLSVISDGMDNGRVIARQVDQALNRLFSSLRAEVIAEHFAKEHNAGALFSVARELDNCAHSVDMAGLHTLTTEARAIIGVYCDFVQASRSALLNGPGSNARSPRDAAMPDALHGNGGSKEAQEGAGKAEGEVHPTVAPSPASRGNDAVEAEQADPREDDGGPDRLL
jgi:hypothetical protein